MENPQPLHRLGIAELQQGLAQKHFSAVELAQALAARTRQLAHLNGYVDFDPAPFLAQAARADAVLARGDAPALTGIPLALKDNIGTADLPTGAGTGALHGRRPRTDAEVARRLRAAGAVVAGKAGMHELAFGISSDNAVTGRIRNPWAPDCIPGGSSGGSAVVVSAGLVPAALGTDTGASVRLPAALCGIAGLRPTVGRIPGAGIAPISATRDTAGPMARSVHDLALLDTVMAQDTTPLADVPLRGLRLGLPAQRFWDACDASVTAVMAQAREALERAGVVLVEVALPELDALNAAVGFPVALYEFMAQMPDYLREAGHDVDLPALLAGIGSPDVAGLLQPLLKEGVPEAAYREALAARERLQAMYRDAFAQAQVEALAFPTAPLTARPLLAGGEVEFLGTPQPAFLTYIRNTDPGSNAGIPGLSLPAGVGPDGLPVGLALDGPTGSDRRLLAMGAAIERVLPPPAVPPLA
ncbi:mandelamide amidase [Pseudacidovorax intermedius]|uniref:Mandelamide amidase n=2 Tax=Pseudacidovorax intermedius TaxID=433924 RepID=A0A370FMX8_9BURK|nr:indoleacetamide hydrolase [Pseudacidovorax intermedius]RDI28593.1 mandelamide amidase [Pseudacidovorax intermedius]